MLAVARFFLALVAALILARLAFTLAGADGRRRGRGAGHNHGGGMETARAGGGALRAGRLATPQEPRQGLPSALSG